MMYGEYYFICSGDIWYENDIFIMCIIEQFNIDVWVKIKIVICIVYFQYLMCIKYGVGIDMYVWKSMGNVFDVGQCGIIV